MALSEREQRLLDELEKGLYETDANFASKIAGSTARTPAKMVGGIALFLIGVSLLVFSAIIQTAAFGVLAFLLMVSGLVFASSNLKVDPSSAPVADKSKVARKNIFEERWEKRRGE